jgi:hypothetical protein
VQVLNYGQSVFEGMKAQRSAKGNIVLFRCGVTSSSSSSGTVVATAVAARQPQEQQQQTSVHRTEG